MGTDYKSGLPIRSESDGADEKVVVKIIDGQPGGTNQVQVDADKNAHVEVHGNNPAGTDEVLRLSELGAVTPDGVYDVANNTKPGNVGLIGHQRSATPGDATQTERLTSISGQDDTKALDVAIRHSNGNRISDAQPLPVTFVDAQGAEINDYHESAAPVVKDATDTHEYTAANDMKFTQWEGSASVRTVFLIEVAPDGLTYSKKFTKINSTANPNVSLMLKEAISIPAGGKVKVTMTNRDNQAATLYSTISGHEVTA